MSHYDHRRFPDFTRRETYVGAVYGFGDAGVAGSLAGQPLARPVVGMSAG